MRNTGSYAAPLKLNFERRTYEHGKTWFYFNVSFPKQDWTNLAKIKSRTS